MFRCIDCPLAWCGACKPPTLTILGKSTVPGLKTNMVRRRFFSSLCFVIIFLLFLGDLLSMRQVRSNFQRVKQQRKKGATRERKRTQKNLEKKKRNKKKQEKKKGREERTIIKREYLQE